MGHWHREAHLQRGRRAETERESLAPAERRCPSYAGQPRRHRAAQASSRPAAKLSLHANKARRTSNRLGPLSGCLTYTFAMSEAGAPSRGSAAGTAARSPASPSHTHRRRSPASPSARTHIFRFPAQDSIVACHTTWNKDQVCCAAMQHSMETGTHTAWHRSMCSWHTAGAHSDCDIGMSALQSCDVMRRWSPARCGRPAPLRPPERGPGPCTATPVFTRCLTSTKTGLILFEPGPAPAVQQAADSE